MRISEWSSDVCSSDLTPFAIKRDANHKYAKLLREFPDERPQSGQIWSVSGRAGALPSSSPQMRAEEPSGHRRRRMESGRTGLVLRHGRVRGCSPDGPRLRSTVTMGRRLVCQEASGEER